MAQLANLQSINDETDALSARIEIGEPSPASLTLRTRFGSLVKRRLKRLLWWQNYQVKALVALTLRRGREEIKVLETLSQSVGALSQELRETRKVIDALSEKLRPLTQQMREIHHIVSECKREIRQSESRLGHLESAQSILQTSEIEQNARIDERLETERISLRQELNEVKHALNLAETHLAEERKRDSGVLTQKVDELTQRVDSDKARQGQIAARLSELGLFTHQTRAILSIQDRRLGVFIEEARKRLPEPLTDHQLKDMANSHADHRYDSLYLAFEDVFRGSREDIKSRQSVYLPFLKEHGIGCSTMPILDLGCGRGEWLELLGEHGLQARGIDQNELMIEHCRSAGLEVTQSDALRYLSTLPDACIGAVTSFHMVEHMPFDLVLAIVDESLRVLKAGGILILETPNPQNILVGAYTFYFDPSHRKPLPSPMLQFYVEARGFCNVRVKELHPYPEAVRLPDGGQGLGSRLNEYLYGPQDYAVIGEKPEV